jgi:Family of unknown function (DUF6188)
MYDLPKGITLEFLKDRELAMLCFGPYTLTLHFDDETQIQIEGSFEHRVAENGVKSTKSAFATSDSRLMRLLLQRVTLVAVKRDGTLRIGFANGDRLVIEGNVGPYESYNINHPGSRLIVV